MSNPEWNRSWSGSSDCRSARDNLIEEVKKMEELAGREAPEDLTISFMKD